MNQNFIIRYQYFSCFYLFFPCDISMTPIVFKPGFYIFSYNKQLRKIIRNFINKFLLFHTSLNASVICYQKLPYSAFIILLDLMLLYKQCIHFASYFFSICLSNNFGAIFIQNERVNNEHYQKIITSYIYNYSSRNTMNVSKQKPCISKRFIVSFESDQLHMLIFRLLFI